MVVFALHGEVAKALPVVRLATHKLLLSVDAVVGVKLIATTFAGKHMTTVLPSFALDRHWKKLDSLVTDMTWVIPLSPLDFVPRH